MIEITEAIALIDRNVDAAKPSLVLRQYLVRVNGCATHTVGSDRARRCHDIAVKRLLGDHVVEAAWIASSIKRAGWPHHDFHAFDIGGVIRLITADGGDAVLGRITGREPPDVEFVIVQSTEIVASGHAAHDIERSSDGRRVSIFKDLSGDDHDFLWDILEQSIRFRAAGGAGGAVAVDRAITTLRDCRACIRGGWIGFFG